MGLFKEMIEGFNEGREKARNPAGHTQPPWINERLRKIAEDPGAGTQEDCEKRKALVEDVLDGLKARARGCDVCDHIDRSERLETHDIRETFVSERRHLVVLCPACHGRLHRGKTERSQLLYAIHHRTGPMQTIFEGAARRVESLLMIEPLGTQHPEFYSMLGTVRKWFTPAYARDEEELEQMLTIFLEQRYPGRIERQVKRDHGKIDIVFDREYGVELKLAENPTILRNLIGQARFYTQDYRKVAVILFVDYSLITESEVETATKQYEADGVECIIIKGQIRRQTQ